MSQSVDRQIATMLAKRTTEGEASGDIEDNVLLSAAKMIRKTADDEGEAVEASAKDELVELVEEPLVEEPLEPEPTVWDETDQFYNGPPTMAQVVVDFGRDRPGDDPYELQTYYDAFADEMRSRRAESERVAQVASRGPVAPKMSELDKLPRFNHTSGITQLLRLADFGKFDLAQIDEALIAKGYPKFWAPKVFTLSRPKSGKVDRARELRAKEIRRQTDDGDYAEERKSRSAKIITGQALPKGLGKVMPLYWRIPSVTQNVRVLKPTAKNYTKQAFKQWIHYCATQLRPFLGTKKHFVTANDMACNLYMGTFTGSPKALADVLSRIRVYVASYVNEPEVTKAVGYISAIRLPDGHSAEIVKRRLLIGSVWVESADWLVEHEPAFRKHKPLYRASLQFFAGALDRAAEFKLQDALHKAFTPVLQGNTMTVQMPSVDKLADKLGSVPLRVEHTMPDLSAFTAAFAASQDDSFPRRVAQVVAFFVSLSKATDYIACVSATAQFVAGCPKLWGMLTSLLGRLTPVPVYQSGLFSKPIGEVFAWDGFPTFFAVTITGVLQTLMGEAYDFVASFRGALIEMVFGLRASMMKETTTMLARYFLDVLHEAATRITNCFKEKSLAPLWGEGWDPRRWVRTVECFMTHYPLLTSTGVEISRRDDIAKLRKTGSLPVWFTEPEPLPQFVALLEDYHTRGKELGSSLKSFSELAKEVGQVTHRLRVFIDTLHAQIATGNMRLAPFMIVFYGPPGSGKTNFAGEVAHALGRVEGYDVSSSSTYLWQEGVNFQDGLNHTQWHIHMDDVDQTVAKDAPGVRNFAQHVVALVNNNPFPVEMASVELKGKVRANPRLLTYCTNFDHCNLADHTMVPDAFWRRVSIRVEVLAKPEFSVGGGVLDAAKAASATTYELFDLKVSFYSPVVAKNGRDKFHIPFTAPKKMSVAEFNELVVMMYRKHMERQRALLLRSSVGTHCRVCGLMNNPGGKTCAHFAAEIPQDDPKPVPRDNDVVVDAVVQGQGFSSMKEACRRKVALRTSPTALIVDLLVDEMMEQLAGRFTSACKVMAAVALCIAVFRTQYQSREANASEGLVPKGWFRAEQTFAPGLPPSLGATFTYDELVSAVRACTVKIWVDGVLEGTGSVVSQNCVLAPSHFFANRFGKMAEFELRGVRTQVQITQLNFCRLVSDPEACVVRVGSLSACPGLLSKMWGSDALDVQTLDEVHLVSLTDIRVASSNARISTEVGPRWRVSGFETIMGDCGQVYVGRHGSSWKVFAMHFQWIPGFNWAVGFICTQQVVKSAIALLGAVYQGVSTPNMQLHRTPEQVEFLPFPVKSEAWAAMSAGAKITGYGEIYPPVSGATVKTKIVRSLIYDDVGDLEERFCGHRGYWNLPDFRGRMQGDEWVSPYTVSFKSQNLACPDLKCMWLAVADYLSGIEHLSLEGWRKLSEQEAIVGIPHSYIHAVNMKTSVGPPFNTSKRKHFTVYELSAYFSPDVARLKDQIDEMLVDSIPCAVGLCTLKDEPVKLGKLPRVFTCLSAAYNLTLKQHLSPIKSFMRSHRMFFESYVGVDMTSAECRSVPDQLALVDPTLTNLYDMDATKLDKSFSGHLFDFVGHVWYAIAVVLGLPDPDSVERLILGLKHTKFIIKGDLFHVFWNPSGHDATVEVNGTVMSLGERYVFYRTFAHGISDEEVLEYVRHFRTNPVPSALLSRLVFRQFVGLCTYGDDTVKSLRDGYQLPDNYLNLWKDEIGIVITDATKSLSLVRKNISEIQFLKRRFVWSDRYKRYLTPLDVKSMTRTLLMKKESILTLPDHACVAMTEVLREAVYHGEEFYNELLVRFTSLSEKYQLSTNPYLQLHPYAHWDEMLVAGTFAAWEPRVNVQPNPNDVDSSDR